jgi:hypothetical protein
LIAARAADLVRRHRVAAFVLALALLAGGALSLASSYRAVGIALHETTRDRWSEEASYAYVVPVVRNSTHWPVGTQLPMGLPAYYRTVSDSFALSFAWRAANASGTASADMALRIVAQTTDGRVYWDIVHPLAQGDAGADGALRLDAVLDMDALVAEADRIGKELPIGEGKVVWSVETTVAYAMTADGARDDATSSFVFPITVQDPRFILPAPEAATWEQPHSETRTWTSEHVAGAGGALSDLKGLALLAGGAALLALVAWLALGDPLRTLAARDAAYVREHLRHSEWVTSVPGPIDVSSFPAAVVDVADLETLIETAADARSRVLHDHAQRIYYTVLPNATYRYARHARA